MINVQQEVIIVDNETVHPQVADSLDIEHEKSNDKHDHEQSHHPILPNNFSSKNTREVQILNSAPINCDDNVVGYKLQYRENCGKPPNRYTYNHEVRGRRYPIANHVYN